MMRLKKRITGPSPTATKTHPRRIPHVLPTHVQPHHPPTTHHPPTKPLPQQYNSSGAVRSDQSTTAAQQYGSTHHSIGTSGEAGWDFHFLTILHLPGQSASRHPPSTHHPPPTHRPTHHHSSSTAVEQYVPTNPQRQHNTHHSGTPVVRQELGGIYLHFLTTLHLPGEREPSPIKHLPPTTHPPTNPPPQQYNSSSTYRPFHNGSTQQYDSTRHSGTPVVRQELRGTCTFLRFSTFRGRARAVTHQAPITHRLPTDQPTTTAAQQQWSSTYRRIHNGSTVRTKAVHLWYARSWVGFALFYDSPPSGGEREPSPGGAFHAPRSRSWGSSAVVLPGTPRADVWGGHGTGVRSLGAGWRAVEQRVVSVLF